MQRVFCLLVVLGFHAPGLTFAQTRDRSGDGRMFNAATLGSLAEEAQEVVLLEVVKVDPERRRLTFKKTGDLKGKHAVGEFEFRFDGENWGGEARNLLSWARPGRTVIGFTKEGAVDICLCFGNCWYQAEIKGTVGWTLDVVLPEYAQVYVGRTDRLREHLAAILAKREVVVTAESPASGEPRGPVARDWARGQKGRVWRVRASLQIKEKATLPSVKFAHFVG